MWSTRSLLMSWLPDPVSQPSPDSSRSTAARIPAPRGAMFGLRTQASERLSQSNSASSRRFHTGSMVGGHGYADLRERVFGLLLVADEPHRLRRVLPVHQER